MSDSPINTYYWLAAAAAAAAACWALYKFIASIHRDRIITDTPLVKIRSAAQGYVKVFGRTRPATEPPTAAPLSERACVWWSYQVEKKEENSKGETRWRTVENATSVEPFALADADGECLVGPINAEITPTVHDVWYGNGPRPAGPPALSHLPLGGDDFRYTEQLLKVGDQLSVTGELRSISEIDDADTTAAALLRQWKQDQPALLRRFDHNHDGRIDAAEWETARQAAAAQAHAKMLQAPVVRISVIGEPTHGEPFLIAPMDVTHLVQREKWRAALYFAIGLACVVLCAWIVEHIRGVPTP